MSPFATGRRLRELRMTRDRGAGGPGVRPLATGRRLRELPMTRDRVLEALA